MFGSYHALNNLDVSQVASGVLLMYWKMTFCPKFIRCFGLLFVLKLEIFKTLSTPDIPSHQIHV